MAIPLTTQVFNAFLGTNEGTNVLLLPDAFSSEGSVNVWMDKFGRVRSWGGYSALNSSVSHGDRFAGLFQAHIASMSSPFIGTTGVFIGFIEHLDSLTFKTYLVTSTDGTSWTELTNASAGRDCPDFAQFGTVVYITAPNSIGNYTYDGTSAAAITNTQSPQPSVSEGSTGVLNGSYKYKLVSIHGTTGARKLASLSSTLITTTNKQLSLSWTADADTNQGGYELYRTSGTGNLYYFVTYIDGRTTVAYTDNNADSAIFQNRVLEEHGDAPPSNCWFVEGHKGRLWWGGTGTYPDRVWWSDPQLPTSVLDTNYIVFSDNEIQGDKLAGMIGSFRDTLVVFTERAVWTVSGTGSVVGYVADWNRVRSNARIGSVSHRSALRVPSGARYVDEFGSTASTSGPTLAYWTPLGDIRLFDGDNDTIISTPIQDTIRGFNYSQRRYICGVHDQDANQMIWFYPTTGSDYCNAAIVWNYKWGVWYQWTGLDVGSAVAADSGTDPAVVVLGSGSFVTGATDNKLAKAFVLDANGSANGTAIVSVWQSKPLYGSDENGVPLLTQSKRWRWADLRFDFSLPSPGSTTSVNVTVQDALNTASASYNNPSFITGAGHAQQVKVRCQARSLLNFNTFADYVHSPSITLFVSATTTGSSTDKGWALDGFALTYQVLSGQKRRFD